MEFNKKMAAIGAVLIISAGVGTATVLDFFGTTNGNVNVQNAALDVNGQQQNSLSVTSPGKYQLVDMNSQESHSYLNLSPNAEQVTVDLQATYTEKDGSTYDESTDGVTSHYMPYELPNYNTSNDIVVDADENSASNHYATIQAAVTAAETNGNTTVYVEEGTYGDFDVSNGEDIEVISVAGPEDTEIDLQNNTISIVGSTDLKVQGFTVTGSEDSNDRDGAIAHLSGGSGNLQGELVVEDNIIDGDFLYRYVWSQETANTVVEDNFFTGDSDAGVEVNAKDTGSATVTVDSNTFAGLADKGVALRMEDGSTDSVKIRNNNFVSNSNAAIQTGWSGAGSYTHATPVADSNYFNHTGTKVEDNTGTGLDSSILNEADNPQTDDTVTVNRDTQLFQVTYLDIALDAGTYGLNTSIAPVR